MPPGSHRHLPRLQEDAYRGHQFVHWIMTLERREQGWLNEGFHGDFRAILQRRFREYAVAVPAYCLMPDHLHILAAGISPLADQLLWARATRRALNLILAPRRLQKQAYDHILREHESGPDAFTALTHYITENPVRAALTKSAGAWPYSGSVVAALPDLDPRHPDFRDHWWAYWTKRES